MANNWNYEAPPNLPFIEFHGVCGRGGMATVWHGWHKVMKCEVAVKILDSNHLTPDEIRQFQTEGRAMAYLNHPGIVHGYGAETVDGRPFYLMDYVDGYSLASLIQRKGHMTESDILTVIIEVAEALNYAWTEFHTVHCDLKPDNLMVSRDGTIKVMDLGLACEMMFPSSAPGTENEAGEVAGTPAYMSPENIYGDVKLDCRSDIYSLGATAYHLATGRILFPGLEANDVVRAHVDMASAAPDPRLFMPNLSQGFVQLLEGMLVKNREGRYQTWEEVQEACFVVTEGQVPARPSGGVSSVRLA